MLVELRHAPDPRVLLDVALVKLTNVDADASPAALLARIEKLERAQSAGSGAPAGPAAAARAGAARGGTRSGGGRAPTGRERARRRAIRRRSHSPPTVGGTGQGRQRRHRGADAAVAAAPAAEVAAPVAAADQVAPSVPTVGNSPSRDELTLVWADQVLPHLSARRSRSWPPGTGSTPTVAWRSRCPTSPTAPAPSSTGASWRPRWRPTSVGPSRSASCSSPRRRRGPAAPPSAVPGPRPIPSRRRRRSTRPSSSTPPPEHDLAPFDRVTQAFPGAELIDEG